MNNLHVDALVVGGGIAGMQAALDLGDQGFKVALYLTLKNWKVEPQG